MHKNNKFDKKTIWKYRITPLKGQSMVTFSPFLGFILR